MLRLHDEANHDTEDAAAGHPHTARDHHTEAKRTKLIETIQTTIAIRRTENSKNEKDPMSSKLYFTYYLSFGSFLLHLPYCNNYYTRISQ